jgi:PAS domain S-box-containing protein
LYAPDNRIALIHSGGTVFTAMPDGTKSIIGQNLLKSSSLYVQHVRDGRTRSVQSGRSSTTGDTRVFAYIDNKPKDLRFNKYLVVAASRNLDEALVPWKMDTALDVLLYLFTSATILLVTRIQLRRSVELSKLHATQDSILESAGDGILGLDRSGTILFCNQAAGRLTGKGRTELIGHNFHQALHSDSAGHDSADCPLRVTLKDGVKRTVNDCMLANLGSVEYTVTPLFEQNEVAGVVIVFRDVTEQRKMEAVSRQALETATTANVTMSRLMNVVAHEFRTPLGLLTGSTDILDRYWDRLSPEKRLEQNAHIRSAASQISSLVNSVISFNQAGRDGAMQQALVTDLEDACRSIVAEIETVWSAGHLFRCTVVTDGSPLLLDQSLFQRILKNLLSNAFRYTSPAGTISLSVCREKNQLLLEVTDTGIGIPEEDQKLIFDPFYRSSNVEDRRGLGLGLSIVNDALAKLGGTITLLSNVGEGTTVTVKLPVIESIEE